MNKTAIAKRIGGAALLCGLAVAAYFVLRPVLHWIVSTYDAGSVNALSVLGVKASPDAAGDFMLFLLVVLLIVFQRPRAKAAGK
jgi:hypothetical protein